MKRFILILLIGMVQAMGWGLPAIALAATPKGRPTPTSGHKIAKTPMDKIQLRLSHQTAQIKRELKLGKLTVAQAKTLKGQVASIRKTETDDLKADNSKTLTDAQFTELNQQLDTLSKSVPMQPRK